MKRFLAVFGIFITSVLLVAAPVSAAKPTPTATITLLNAPPSGVLELGVGEKYTFDILITSNEPFVLAMALPNAFFPGRGVFWHDSDRATQSTSAVLHLTVKGKNPTAGLPAVFDWPIPGISWPDGVAPLAIAAGVRFKGGAVIAQTFAFAVAVH